MSDFRQNRNEKERREMLKLLAAGLATDGKHHKQWYLEQALRFVASEYEFGAFKQVYQWEDGIAP